MFGSRKEGSLERRGTVGKESSRSCELLFSLTSASLDLRAHSDASYRYLWNPYTLLTCFARSTTSLDNMLVILSIYFGASRSSLYFLFASTCRLHSSPFLLSRSSPPLSSLPLPRNHLLLLPTPSPSSPHPPHPPTLPADLSLRVFVFVFLARSSPPPLQNQSTQTSRNLRRHARIPSGRSKSDAGRLGKSLQRLEGHPRNRRLDAQRRVELVLLHRDVRSFQTLLYNGLSGESSSLVILSFARSKEDQKLTRRFSPLSLLSFSSVDADAHRYLRRPLRSHFQVCPSSPSPCLEPLFSLADLSSLVRPFHPDATLSTLSSASSPSPQPSNPTLPSAMSPSPSLSCLSSPPSSPVRPNHSFPHSHSPSLADLPTLVPSSVRSKPKPHTDLRNPLPSLNLHLYSLILLPLLHHLWLGAGSGNANFFYASTLVFGLGNALFGVDLVVAGRVKGFDLVRARKSVELKEREKLGEGEREGEGDGREAKWEVVQVAG